ncbi:flexible cuticle protein 12-like [Contarinia nasturtii]|uniref:flexible cuticle protein 12-like n=1 Tax=Contarinia nasturtii TaxID=265458 RepID=UPI0012D3823F|nr:flexible cuticle protein 12-like [Contarinia nasturtii]
MKVIIAFAAIVAIAIAFPQAPDSTATVLKNENSNIGVGDYHSQYETSNNIQSDESGELRQGPEGYFLAKHGSYSYTAPDGILYTVQWTADENGFKAEGTHLPKPLV